MSTLFRVEHPTSGIGLWYREDGVKVDFIRHELEAGHRGELVVGGNLGMLVQGKEPDGGLDLEAVAARLDPRLPMLGRVLGMDLYGGLAIFSAFVAVDTQVMIERARCGQGDVAHDALNMFVNVLQIFIRIAEILRGMSQ